MSSYSNSNSSNSNSKLNKSSKPFCKVCYDAGKPEKEYTSHYVKSKPGNEGKVVCPYLLSIVCTYCKKKEGHTAKHCPVLANKNTRSIANKEDKHIDDGWNRVGSSGSSKRSQNEPITGVVKPVHGKYAHLAVIIEKEEQNIAELQQHTEQMNMNYPVLLPSNLAASPFTPPVNKIQYWSSIVKNAPVAKPEPAKPEPAKPEPAYESEPEEFDTELSEQQKNNYLKYSASKPGASWADYD